MYKNLNTKEVTDQTENMIVRNEKSRLTNIVVDHDSALKVMECNLSKKSTHPDLYYF